MAPFRPQHPPSRNALGFSKVVTSLPSVSNGVTAVLRGPHLGANPGSSLETPGATRTEEIIYHLQLTGLQDEGNLENSSVPWFKEHLAQILFRARHLLPFSAALWIPALGHHHALLHGRKPLPSPPSHPALSSDIGPSQGAYNPTGNRRLTTQETHKYLGARTLHCFVT